MEPTPSFLDKGHAYIIRTAADGEDRRLRLQPAGANPHTHPARMLVFSRSPHRDIVVEASQSTRGSKDDHADASLTAAAMESSE